MKRYKRKNLEVERKNQKSRSKGEQPAMDSQTNHLKKRGKSIKKRIEQSPRFGLCKSGRFPHGTTECHRNVTPPPPKDMMNESTRLEQMTSGVKSESVRVLRTKVNITDLAMQGRRSFTFEYEGTTQNRRFYKAKVKFSLKSRECAQPCHHRRHGASTSEN